MSRRATKVEAESDASTDPENVSDEEFAQPTKRGAKVKKRFSAVEIPLNDIQNAADEDTGSDASDRATPPVVKGLKRKSSTIEMNDDNAEKRKRRKSAKHSVSYNKPPNVGDHEEALRSSQSKRADEDVPATPKKNASGSGSGPKTPKVSALARANHLNAVAQTPVPAVPVDILNSKYEEWMKMATDNKINANNAWNFALIDYFQDMSLLRNELDNSINFQKASFTLDGCVKIWTSRVDSVGTETGKLLSNLADEIRGAREGDEREDGDEGDGDGEGKVKKQKAHRSEATLAKSFAALQVKKLDLEFTVDPLFKKTCADFDEGGAMGLLLNHLAVDEKLRVVFDAGDSRLEGVDEENPDVESLPVDLTELRAKFLPSVDAISTKTITESLADFHFAMSGNAEQFMNSFGKSTYNDAQDDDDGASVGGDGPLGDFGMGGDDMPMDDGPAEDFFTGDQAIPDDPVNYAAANAEEGEGIRTVPLGPVENFDPRRAPNERDLVMAMAEDGEEMLDYFDTAVMKNWAGPQHWKLRRVAKKADPATEGTAPAKTKKEKVSFEIDFSAPPVQSSKELFAPATGSTITMPAGTGALVSTASSTGKRKSKKTNIKRDDHLLPDDMHFSSAQLLRLFRKPKFTPQEWKASRNPDYHAATSTTSSRTRAAPSIGSRGGAETSRSYLLSHGSDESQRTRTCSKSNSRLPQPAQAGSIIGGRTPVDDALGIGDAVDDAEVGRAGGDGNAGFDDGYTMDLERYLTVILDGVGEDFAERPDGEIDERFWANAAAAHAQQGPLGGEDGDETGPLPFNTQFLNEDDYDDGPGLDDDFGGDDVPRTTEEEDLLAATQGLLKRTRPEFVNYAKKAKRVDVRKLKENIWKSLDIVVDHGDKEEDEEEDEDRSVVNEKPPTDPKDAREFSNVIHNLESSYPREKMEEISTSFCFICLLHLANEQGLKIETQPSSRVEVVNDDDDDVEAGKRVGDLWGLKVFRDPNATRAA
ncbi:hypothetical protein FRC04_012060 [Tulasnella sp. 424]|nr:hypothetical protein FRC04_012060 [Tulasnella sp. 424]KAG8975818.1 hypothetical protein FRC05_005028 [Tulasnella sp. 425]